MNDIRRITYDPADTGMVEGVMALLAEAFGREYMAYYRVQLRTLASKELTHVYTHGKEVVAHVQVVPYAYGSMRFAYLYAVCTRANMRGQGIMRGGVMPEVMRAVYEQGYEGIFLVPSEGALIGFYEQFGFRSMRGGAFTSEEGIERAITPGAEALQYLEETAAISGETVKEHNQISLVAGWMLHMVPMLSLPEETTIINPLM